MRYRERFEATLEHKEVDRVPFDLAGTPFTNIENAETVQKIRDVLGFSGKYDDWYPNFDERILRYFDIDIRKVGNILVPQTPASYSTPTEDVDVWGIKRAFTGQYWDIVGYPLRGATSEDLDNYPWPDPDTIDMRIIDQYRELAKKLYYETDYVVCAEHPVLGVFELGCWMCGFDDFMLKMAMDEGFVFKFFDKILDYQKKVIEIYYGALGDYIHFTTSGDDFGTQTGPFISPAMFRKFIKPYFKERIEYTKKYTRAHYFHHTCGSVYTLIPDLIDAGVEILNPIQPGARDMSPEKLKDNYGDSITFHGGIDTQYILPYGKNEDVKNEVFQKLDVLSKNGGYILAPAHNIQSDVPADNIIALYNAGKEYYNMI